MYSEKWVRFLGAVYKCAMHSLMKRSSPVAEQLHTQLEESPVSRVTPRRTATFLRRGRPVMWRLKAR